MADANVRASARLTSAFVRYIHTCMDNQDMNFGGWLAKLRKRRRMSQGALGQAVGLSQATVSRLESEADPPDDTKLLARLAQGLGISITDLLDGFPTPSGLGADVSGEFFSFCPNPLCDANEVGRNPTGVFVKWKSGQVYPANMFSEINFCGRCGEELVKECPSCKRPLRRAGTKYCVTCGTQVVNRPTAAEWKLIEQRVPGGTPEPAPDDDLPF
jgi:DNA-binding XRE family transcriptional regulator